MDKKIDKKRKKKDMSLVYVIVAFFFLVGVLNYQNLIKNGRVEEFLGFIALLIFVSLCLQN